MSHFEDHRLLLDYIEGKSTISFRTYKTCLISSIRERALDKFTEYDFSRPFLVEHSTIPVIIGFLTDGRIHLSIVSSSDFCIGKEITSFATEDENFLNSL